MANDCQHRITSQVHLHRIYSDDDSTCSTELPSLWRFGGLVTVRNNHLDHTLCSNAAMTIKWLPRTYLSMMPSCNQSPCMHMDGCLDPARTPLIFVLHYSTLSSDSSALEKTFQLLCTAAIGQKGTSIALMLIRSIMTILP